MKIVTAIIIAYNPDVEILENNVLSLLSSKYIKDIIIVDNSYISNINFQSKFDNVDIVFFGENKGIATAQNVGIKKAIENNSKYVVLFDQDSTVENDLVSKLYDGLISSKCDNLIAVGPRPYDILESKKSKPLVQKESKLNENITICSQIIASGKLIDLDAINKVGFMEDDLFIDGVDHEWCWRAKKNGYIVAIVENAIMPHTLGDARGRFLFFSYKIASPIRLYYQFRNILILSRRNYVPLYWKIRNLLAIPVRLFIFILLGENRLLRLKYMLKGIYDGIVNKKGAY
ncbi:TPA: glycosyltransferase family 2 protein [Photobacterium damselae]